MEREKSTELLEKYHDGTCTEHERAAVEAWYNFHGKSGNSSSVGEEELEAKKLEIWSKIELDRYEHSGKTKKLWPGIRIAASIAAAVATIVFGVWFFAYRSSNISDSLQTGVYANDIAPGKNGATVTLSTGEIIRLDSTKQGVKIDPTSLTYDDGTRGAGFGLKAETVVEMTAVTTKGQTYIFTLPDGSKVWLNAATTLKFPSTFANKISREVEVDGEAYFEVFKNKSQPFVVKTKKLGNTPEQEIKVLGTHFNVNAYANESAITTTLLEGSVKVTAGQIHQVLKPGFQAINERNKIRVIEADVENTIDWKNNEFILDNQTLKSSLQKIARWYDVELIYESDVQLDVETGGIIPRNSKLSSVLRLIESSGLAHFRIEGKKLYVTKPSTYKKT